MKLLNPNLFKNKHTYGLRYCDAQQRRWSKFQKHASWDYKGASNLDELKFLLEKIVMIRRHKKDVLNQLPKKRREMVMQINEIVTITNVMLF